MLSTHLISTHFLSTHLLSTHLLPTHLVSTHLLSIHLYQLTWYQNQLPSTSSAIHTFPIKSLAICFTSSQFTIRSHLLSRLTCYQVNLRSGLTCSPVSPDSLAIRSIYYQVSFFHVFSPFLTAINAHLLSETSYYLNTSLSILFVF